MLKFIALNVQLIRLVLWTNKMFFKYKGAEFFFLISLDWIGLFIILYDSLSSFNFTILTMSTAGYSLDSLRNIYKVGCLVESRDRLYLWEMYYSFSRTSPCPEILVLWDGRHPYDTSIMANIWGPSLLLPTRTTWPDELFFTGNSCKITHKFSHGCFLASPCCISSKVSN